MGKLTLAILYILPLVLVVWVWIGLKRNAKGNSTGNGRAQILALLLLPAAYIGHWLTLESLEGWPTGQSLPEEFQLLAGHIVEPDKQRKLEGRIDIWIKLYPDSIPRAYSLPYDRALHERLHASLEKIKTGRNQTGYHQGREAGDKNSNHASTTNLVFDTPPPRHLPMKP